MHERADATADDHALAAELAAAAGQLLLDVRSSWNGEGGKALGIEGDRVANVLLLERLAERVAAGDGLLSEEAVADAVAGHRQWIVDPLDGSREYGEPPRTDWAVHVALAVGGEPRCGAVALPAQDLVLHTGEPPVVPEPDDGPIRFVVSRTRPGEVATKVAAQFDSVLVPMGSAGAKTMAVVTGEADAYVHSGGQYQWDSCAPVAVALAAGLHASRLDGSPLHYGDPDPYLPDLVVCRADLAERVLDTIDGLAGLLNRP